MKLGCIVRGDHGGLASQTYEAWRHLKPDKALLVDLGIRGGRGATDIDRYRADWCETIHYPRRGHGMEIEQFLEGLDVVWSAETVYDDRLFAISRSMNVKIVVQLNPELFWDSTRYADGLWNPTVWRIEHLPERVRVVPCPVALDRFEYRPRRKIDVLFHTAGEAMLDRNGTKIVEVAMRHVDRPCKLYIRGGEEPETWHWINGKVTCEWLPPVDNYDEVIPEETDLLLMPRRYGGLCLPVQEAAAMGIPSLMTRLLPQKQWMASDLLVNAFIAEPGVRMKGGEFDVYGVDPRLYADGINYLLDNDRIGSASRQARDWAETRSWDVLLPVWRKLLDEAAAITVP